MLEPWAPISQRLRRNFKLRHYLFVATLDLRPADALKIENAFLERAEG